MRGTVRTLLVKPRKGATSVSVQEVEARLGGFAGDYHTGSSRQRQILLMSGSILDALDLEPGAIYENVVVDGFDVMALQEGQQLQLGDAVVSVTFPCEPCIRMDRVRRGLQDALQNRRGMFVKVVSPGTVRLADSVETL